jgi:hypothetical protein
MVLQGILGLQWEQVTGGWRIIRNVEFSNLYATEFYLDKIKYYIGGAIWHAWER